MIPYGRQDINDADLAAVIEVLNSDFLTQGPKVPEFEAAITSLSQAKYAVAMNSATSALHLACLALGVRSGDLVWTSPISFVASANCALYCGADIDFVDVEVTTGLLSVDALSKKLADAALDGRLPKVLIPVHLAGHCCDMAAIHRLCSSYGVKIIEDASHAVGASYQGQPVGNCRFSDITVFSFHAVKIITTAEGGMAVCNNSGIYSQLQLLRSHGITRNESDMTQPSHGPWHYQQIDLGFNYRMTELQAALGLSQLDRLRQFIHHRIKATEIYQQLLADVAVELPASAIDGISAWHLYIIRLENSTERLAVFQALRAAGIGVNVHYIPIHTQPYYQARGFQWGDFPGAEKFYSQIISLPMYATITFEQQQQVADALKQALAHGQPSPSASV